MTTGQHSDSEKLDRILVCLEGEPLRGKPGLVHRVGTLEQREQKRSRVQNKLAQAAGVGLLGAAGAWVWGFITGRH